MKALVTGGGGFLGSRIASMLHERGDDVTVLGRNHYPHHDQAGIKCIRADITDASAVTTACVGQDVVFHVAALADLWGPRRAFERINVGGTRAVIAACRKADVKKLIYTSSPSVVFGSEPLCDVDESTPYPTKYLAHYPRTKAIAERDVLGANSNQLATIALRPHLIWGPGDRHLIPRVVERAKKGQLIQVGDGQNLVDITYIDNAGQAHIQAADRLEPAAPCAGRAYFISQGEPVALWPWLAEILSAVGVPAITRRMSRIAAHRIGTVLEMLHFLGLGGREPRMTRFLASQLAKSHYFSIIAARRDLGYEPTVSTAAGLDRLIPWLQDCGNPRK